MHNLKINNCIKRINPVFLEYYKKKILEGKTKIQALVCVMRRFNNIIYWPGQHGDKNIDGFLNGKFDEVTLKPYSVFEFIKPMKVKAGEIAPWFNEIGGGIHMCYQI